MSLEELAKLQKVAKQKLQNAVGIGIIVVDCNIQPVRHQEAQG
jgi:hypothetical protein